MPIYAAEASTFLTQANGKFDSDELYFGCDGLDGILTKISDSKYCENVMMLTPFAADSTDENVQAFVKAYKDAYGAVPDQFAADGYDAVYTIKAALEQAKITDPNDKDLNSKLVAAMGLAPILVEQIFDIIRELHEAGTTILLVEQNAEMALQIADRAYVLESGRITLSGTGQELMASDSIKKAYLGG